MRRELNAAPVGDSYSVFVRVLKLRILHGFHTMTLVADAAHGADIADRLIHMKRKKIRGVFLTRFSAVAKEKALGLRLPHKILFIFHTVHVEEYRNRSTIARPMKKPTHDQRRPF